MDSHHADDQSKYDDFDLKKYGRVPTLRPGATVAVQAILPCGKLGLVEHAAVLNTCIARDGETECALVATRRYGRKWFAPGGGPWRLVKVVAQSA